MRRLTIPAKIVAHYSGKSDRTIRRMCANGFLEATQVGGEWLISPVGIMRRFWKIGPDVWKRVLYDLYPNKKDAEGAFKDYKQIAAAESAKGKKAAKSRLLPK